MLKKRILASSMASVMALSAVSVVAFADETATSDIKTEVVTLAQLKDYVKSFEKFVEDELDDYGEIQSEWFNNALNAAQAVIDSRFSTEDDITAAYQMLKSVNDKLTMYSQADLKELVADCKGDYDTDNEYNKEFKDEIWKTATWNDFVDAYEHAEDYLDAEDSADLNDAYLGLENAHNALSANGSVSKSQFRTAYNDYAKLLASFSDYEDWMRGTCSVNPTTGNLKDARGNKITLTSASYVTFGDIKNIVYGTSNVQLWSDSEEGRSRMGTPDSGTKWIDWSTTVNGVTVANLNEFIEESYSFFIDNADSNYTTHATITKAYKAAVDAVKVFKGWEAQNVRGSAARVMNDLIKDYRDTFIKKGYADGFVTGITNYSTLFDYDYTKGELKVADGQAADVSQLYINKKTGTFAYTAADAYAAGGTGAISTEIDATTGDYKAAAAADVVKLYDYLGGKNPKVGENLMKYVPMTATMVADGAAAVATDAADAVTDAQNLLDNEITDVKAKFKSETDEEALMTTDLAVGGTGSNYDTDIAAITTYYTDVTGEMTTATFTSEAYEQAITDFEATYGENGASAPTESGDSSVDADEQEAAENYLAAVLNVVAKAKAIVAAEEEAAQAIVDAGSDNVEAWFGQLEDAMDMFEACKWNEAKEKDDKDFADAVGAIDKNETIGKTDTKNAYALLVKYTTFALDNCYPGSSASKTLAEISSLCDKAADLIEETGDATFAKLSENNAKLAEARQAAIEWVAIAKAKKGYKDGDSHDNKKLPYGDEVNANFVYDQVNGIYSNLKADLEEYPHSYAEIAETLAEVAAGIDAGTYGTSAAAIKTAAADIAFTLSTFDAVSDDDNVVYDDDRNFNGGNRLRAKGNGVTDGEKAFTKKYEALLAAVEAATAEPEKPEVVKGDIDGVPGISPADASKALDLFLNDEYLEAADMDDNGVINAADAYAILDAWLQA